jgi:hypothetical protein
VQRFIQHLSLLNQKEEEYFFFFKKRSKQIICMAMESNSRNRGKSEREVNSNFLIDFLLLQACTLQATLTGEYSKMPQAKKKKKIPIQ